MWLWLTGKIPVHLSPPARPSPLGCPSPPVHPSLVAATWLLPDSTYSISLSAWLCSVKPLAQKHLLY